MEALCVIPPVSTAALNDEVSAEKTHLNLGILRQRREATAAQGATSNDDSKLANQRALHVLAGIRQTAATPRGHATAPEKVQGSLTKRGSKYPHRWQRRSFVYNPATRELKYFSGSELKGALVLIGCEKTDAESTSYGIYFEAEERMLLASADTAGERERWIDAVKSSLLFV